MFNMSDVSLLFFSQEYDITHRIGIDPHPRLDPLDLLT
jgi:hypothetical protein